MMKEKMKEMRKEEKGDKININKYKYPGKYNTQHSSLNTHHTTKFIY